MKTTFVYSALAALVMATLLSSCAFLQKGEFAQRKYYDFPRARHADNRTASVVSKHKETSQYNVTIQHEKKSSLSEAFAKDGPAPVLSASVSKKEVILSKTKLNNSSKAEHTVTNTSADNVQTETPIISCKKSEIRNQALKSNRHFPRGHSETMLFVAVIAAIIIPPVGVYIKNNWRINKWFWITLILCILAGGFLGIGNAGFIVGFGILWLAAVIIALMDVFDLL